MEKAKMLLRLPRVSPGYIRYLKTQAVHKAERSGDAVPMRVAILMGAMGVGVSGYSTRQLTLHHKPSASLLERMKRA